MSGGAPAPFVLVHGSNMGAEAWRDVPAILRDAGHAVFAPTLTGLGDRARLLASDPGLTAHVDDVVRVLEDEDLEGAVLVGHSYGGLVATGAAERCPERLGHLVYLDAWAQQDGRSIAEIDPAVLARGKEGRWWNLPDPEATFRRWGIADEAELGWWLARIGPHPLRTFEEGVAVRNPASIALPRTFILCTEGKRPDSPFLRFAETARTKQGWRCRELPTGHLPMSTLPRALAALLLEAAAAPSLASDPV